MQLSDFHFDLPPESIAQYPLPERGASRLLALEGPDAPPADLGFADLPSLLNPEDLLIFNDTRVMRARLFARKETGGRVELLIERLLEPDLALAHLRASKPPRPGSRLILLEPDLALAHPRADTPPRPGARLTLGGDEAALRVEARDPGGGTLWRLRSPGTDFRALMSSHGHIPLPPYILRPDETLDESRYQTVYARREGAVAAPTAGLHFDADMLRRLDGLGIGRAAITLHVGAGTFQPVRVEDPDRHEMHAEWLEVGEETVERIRAAQAAGGRIVAVGTTSTRALETAAADGELRPWRGDSRLFIRPGYRFRVVDAMITNFHLPESTLLMLVAAFSGHARIMAAYRHAVAHGYRFFSYGDAMFLSRSPRLREG